ncbi:hypothetical protein KCP69_02750 [Salmonella enterica subsp. enterica]|nr:hypothetical protein KCP69_02750 [Salmonella enterica subsp. enterica]
MVKSPGTHRLRISHRMDEPTDALTDTETISLFRVIRGVEKSQGAALSISPTV